MLRITFNELVGSGSQAFPDEYRYLAGSYPKLLREVLKENLTKTQKYYIILYYRDHKTVSEIAQLCGVNKSTVSRTLKRARERLCRAIKAQLVSETLNASQNAAFK